MIKIALPIDSTKVKGREKQKVKGTPDFKLHIITYWMYPCFRMPTKHIFGKAIFLQCFAFFLSQKRPLDKWSSDEKLLLSHVKGKKKTMNI